VSRRPTAWRNWADTASCVPARTERPVDAAAVAASLARARRDGLRVRPVGSGHSFSPLAVTDGVHVRLDRLAGVRSVDPDLGLAVVGAGTTLRTLADELAARGFALAVLGDIDRQTVAGAVSTGTHGTGRAAAALSAQVAGLQVVLPDATVATCSADRDPQLFHAARLGLGALGVLTEVTLRVEPSYLLHADEGPASFDQVLERFDDVLESADHVDLHWLPFTDTVQLKRWSRSPGPVRPLPRWRAWWEGVVVENAGLSLVQRIHRAAPAGVGPVNRVAARLVSRRELVDRSDRIFTSRRLVRFLEMEYALPRGVAVPVLRSLRDLTVRGPWRPGFPVEVRSAPPDDVWLSTAHGRETVYVACHAYPRTDHAAWFTACEELFVAYGGRPHWGKLHTRTAADLADVYPRFADVRAVRDRADPERLLANPHLERILGP
jgi:L-gulono-1,4-lactone dehydrogenase